MKSEGFGLLSFNYTNTYEKLYLGLNSNIAPYCIDYLHGKAEICNLSLIHI